MMHNDDKMNTTFSNMTSLEDHKRALTIILRELDRVCKELDIPYILFAGTMLGAVRHGGFIPWDDDVDVLMLRDDYNRFLNEADGILNREQFLLQKEFSEHWPMFFSKLRLKNTTCLEKYPVKDREMHHGIYIDIFPCDNAAKTKFGRKLQFYASKVVIAKSLDRRGYITHSKGKKIFMGLCKLLPTKPFWRLAVKGSADSKFVHSFFAAASKCSKNIYPREYISHTTNASFEGAEYPISKHYDSLLKILYGDYMQLPPPEERKIKQHAVIVDLNNSYEKYLDYHKELKFDDLSQSIR